MDTIEAQPAAVRSIVSAARWLGRRWRQMMMLVFGGWVAWGLWQDMPSKNPTVEVTVIVAGTAIVACVIALGVSVRRRPDRPPLTALVVMVLMGNVIVVVTHNATGWLPSLAVCPFLLGRFSLRYAVPVTLGTLVLMAAVGPFSAGWSPTLGMLGAAVGMASIGVTRRSTRQRLETAQKLLAQEKQAREATARAGVLDERSRLAREVHDILAHTLSAQVVELEGVRLMLKHQADHGQVLEHVDRAQRLARDGLEETRRALDSLRGDVLPLPEALARLTAAENITLNLAESSHPVTPEVSLAVQRIVQESLTNARKHAPGSRVEVTVRFPPHACEASIRDWGATDPGVPALADSGGGYGLAGMIERAKLLGGVVEAGPVPVDSADDQRGKGFRVWVRIPT